MVPKHANMLGQRTSGHIVFHMRVWPLAASFKRFRLTDPPWGGPPRRGGEGAESRGDHVVGGGTTRGRDPLILFHWQGGGTPLILFCWLGTTRGRDPLPESSPTRIARHGQNAAEHTCPVAVSMKGPRRRRTTPARHSAEDRLASRGAQDAGGGEPAPPSSIASRCRESWRAGPWGRGAKLLLRLRGKLG